MPTIKNIFVLEDNIHAEYFGKYELFNNALKKAKELYLLPWDKEPNKCPCLSWETCEREYHIVNFEIVLDKWNELERSKIFAISSSKKEWKYKKDNYSIS